VNHLRDTLNAGYTTVRDLGDQKAPDTQTSSSATPCGRASCPARACSRRRARSSPPAAINHGSCRSGACRRARREEADGVDSLTRVDPRSDRPRRRLDQVVRGLPLGTAAWLASDVHRDEMKRAVEVAESAGVPIARAHQHPRGHAARRDGQCRDDLRARQRRHAGGLQADGRTSRRVVPDADRLGLARGRRPIRIHPPTSAKKRCFKAWARRRRDESFSGQRTSGLSRTARKGRELEAMVAYGMNPAAAVKSATSTAAKVLRMETQIGQGEGRPIRGSCRLRRRSDEGHRGGTPREVRDE